MDLVTANDLVWLSEQRGGIRASLFLPTHRAGPRTARNRIRLKNLLQLARRTLRDGGVPAPAVDTAFQPAEQFVEDRWSSHRPSDGLAVFLGPEEFRLVRVPLRLPELVTRSEERRVGKECRSGGWPERDIHRLRKHEPSA